MVFTMSDFSKSGGVYEAARPDYLRHQVDEVLRRLGVKTDDVVADMGAGTGKLSRMFVSDDPTKPYCKKVVCIERGEEDNGMHRKCVENMAQYGDRAQVIQARAEATTLPDKSVNLIVAGDAAHWFDPPEPVTKEWKRILKNDGKVAIFVRYPDPDSPIVQELHEALKKNCNTYALDNANTLCGDLYKKKGKHLVAEEGSFSQGGPMPKSWTREDLLRYLQSRSSTNVWALDKTKRTTIYENVIDPIFANHADAKNTIEFPYISHVMTGKVREYERSKTGNILNQRATDQQQEGIV